MLDKKFIKKGLYKKKNNNSKKFNLFFKLLFLLPSIKIKWLHKLLVIINNLSYNCKKKLIIKIYKKFYVYFQNYLINFLEICKFKKFQSNLILYKIKGTYLFLEKRIKENKAITYLKFNKYEKKQRLQYYDLVFFNYKLKDFNLYKSFFLKNSRAKWDLSKLNRRKYEKTNKYKFAYKSIFIWPFLITIKPFVITVKNIFFKPFFIYKKWFKKIFNRNKYNKNRLYSQIYNLLIIKLNHRNLNDNLLNNCGIYFWYIMQKYYFCNNININYDYNNQFLNLEFFKYNNIFYRSSKKYKQLFLYKNNSKKSYKKIKNAFFTFQKYFYKYMQKSFIGLSFFFRLYCLYFFWFIHFINKIFYYINKILFNYWFRFFYFTLNFNKIINNNFLISYSILYNNLNNVNYLGFENNIYKLITKIISVYYYNFNLMLKIKLKNNIYNHYFLILFYFYYNNYYNKNSYYNYNILFNNNLKKSYKYNNNFFDCIYIEHYKYSNLYKLEYYNVQYKTYKKYSDYYKINEKKLLSLDVEGKKDYLELINKRNKTLLFR